MVLAPIVVAGCSYEFGGTSDGAGGNVDASSTITGLTDAQASVSATGVTSNASTATTTTDGASVASTGVDVTSSSTGSAPLPRCGNFGDEFLDDDSVTWLYLPGSDTGAGFLRVDPQSVGPFTLGGSLSNGEYPIGECTLSVTGIFIDQDNPRAGVAVANVDFEDLSNVGWLAITWDGTTVRSEVRDGFDVTAGPSLQLASLTRLAIHFTGTTARLYADQTLVGTMDATDWVNGSHRVFAGALDGGNARIDQFNPALMPSDVP